MAGRTIECARGRWRQILVELGVDKNRLRNEHGPCPLCGGRDRFRFDDKEGSGSYYCSHCGPGNGVTMVRKLLNAGFKEAMQAVDRVLGSVEPLPTEAEKKATEPEREARIRKLLDESDERQVVLDYIKSRGLKTAPHLLRGTRALWHKSGRMYPAVVVPILGRTGKLQSAQRIYCADVTPRKTILPPVTTIKGGAARLFPADEVLGIAEGVETAIAAHELWGVPVWAALSAGNMEEFRPPPSVKKLIIFGDHDASYRGQKAVYVLAERLVARGGIEVDAGFHRFPKECGEDWADVAQRISA